MVLRDACAVGDGIGIVGPANDVCNPGAVALVYTGAAYMRALGSMQWYIKFVAFEAEMTMPESESEDDSLRQRSRRPVRSLCH